MGERTRGRFGAVSAGFRVRGGFIFNAGITISGVLVGVFAVGLTLSGLFPCNEACRNVIAEPNAVGRTQTAAALFSGLGLSLGPCSLTHPSVETDTDSARLPTPW